MTRGGAQTSRGEKRENVLFVVLIYESNDIAEIYWQGDLPALSPHYYHFWLSYSEEKQDANMHEMQLMQLTQWDTGLEILTQLRLNKYLQLLNTQENKNKTSDKILQIRKIELHVDIRGKIRTLKLKFKKMN